MASTVGGYARRYVGDLAFDLAHTFCDEDGKLIPFGSVDAALMTMRIKPRGQTARDGEGSWIMVDRAKSQAAWVFAAEDVSTEGIVSFQAGIMFAGKMKHFEVIDIEFETPL